MRFLLLAKPEIIERLSTGIPELNKILGGGIPSGFLVAITGEPGTGKTALCIHFIAEGIKEGDGCIYVTTEESRSSIIKQAAMFGVDFAKALSDKSLIMIDALMVSEDPWSLKNLESEALINKVAEAGRTFGERRVRVVIDSLSAFWLESTWMARKLSHQVKKSLTNLGYTTIVTTQYAITPHDVFGFGVEHVADGIIRFKRIIKGGALRRYLVVEKMRQASHSPIMYEVEVVDGHGLKIHVPPEHRG